MTLFVEWFRDAILTWTAFGVLTVTIPALWLVLEGLETVLGLWLTRHRTPEE